MPLRIGLYNPYLDGLAGGERYCLSLASHWSDTHTVTIFWDNPDILKRASDRFDIDLSRVRVSANFFLHQNRIRKALETLKYDCIFFLSDGSIPMSFARRNIIHFQVPFARVAYNPLKMKRFQAVVCNSRFTKNNLDPRVSGAATVIYPPVRAGSFRSDRKKKRYLLSVGRFSDAYQAKKQEILVEAWHKARSRGLFNGWKLVLAGGMLPSEADFVKNLRQRAASPSVEFYVNADQSKLRLLYEEAPVYWHAAGYNESAPERMEHFGIAVVEAMAAGAVPVAFDGGGLPEIIDDDINGNLWHTTDELIEKTQHLITHPDECGRLRSSAVLRAGQFSSEQFNRSFDALLSELMT